MDFYTDTQKQLQEDFQSRALADRLIEAIVSDAIDPMMHQPFIESRDFFFLSTVTADGEPTVSYKGGDVGVVGVVDAKTVVFPIYDGNGMFLSLGNIVESAKIGLLFIDFETPNRIRVQATASVTKDQELVDRYPGALAVVKANVDKVFLNCARFIHKHERVSTSPYVPDSEGQSPYPAWKRIDLMQDVLRPVDQGRAEAEGGEISMDEYAVKLIEGQS